MVLNDSFVVCIITKIAVSFFMLSMVENQYFFLQLLLGVWCYCLGKEYDRYSCCVVAA
jgi:hypothetical protein